MANVLIKPARKALADKYGSKNVSVRNGTGTAWGWVEANIYLDKNPNCTGDNPIYCDSCRAKLNEASEQAYKLMQQAWNETGVKPYTYYADDGYNTQRDEVLVQARYK